MADAIKIFIYPVRDLDKAKAFYRQLLGVAPYTDEPYYIGFHVAGQEVGLDPHGHAKGMTGPVGYWHVDDIHSSTRALLDAGAEVLQEAKDVGGGRLIATVRDADGNVVGLVQPGSAEHA